MASGKLEARRGRAVPREFNFHWGSGQIIEEAAYVGQYAEPTIQRSNTRTMRVRMASASATTTTKAASNAAR
jgi:hypothetical protein